ncbi:maleylacetoacetate isomerase [Caulobacter soli]|uniref:maleylacetoacetate isomerase n=1 Tax=Caulobacter soli TaxID=2708539 RepID=UPI0013EBEDEE|nr:maleylacetoacetate isomerase [Caulobacter soli]
MNLLLHGYWRSTASYRVRIGLALKGVDHASATHDLRLGRQAEAAYRALAPQGLVPALETDLGVVTQSLAILEWLEETCPTPPLLPGDAHGRAIVRSMAALVACDIHPLNNLRVLQVLRDELALAQPQLDAWIARWIGDGFAALEPLITRHGGAFAYGDQPGLADCLIVPQVYSAQRFKVDLSPYPRLVAAASAAAALPAFAAAHPARQPDADPA